MTYKVLSGTLILCTLTFRLNLVVALPVLHLAPLPIFCGNIDHFYAV